MSAGQYEINCNQCGFRHADELYYGSHEYSIMCARCGYSETWTHKSFFSNGHLEIGVNEFWYSAGAYLVVLADTGQRQFGGLSETDLEKTAAQISADIASGKLSPESFVTKYDFETGELTALVGRVPTQSFNGTDNDLEETLEALGGQEDDDLPSEF